MPYKNMPSSMWAKMDRCVTDVQGKGHDKQTAIAICYTSLMKNKELSATMKSFELKAAPGYRVTRKASDKPSDYLVVGDKTMPTTWHLQVKVNGNPDHNLMGAAWAALHQGYRGNKYEGDDKGKAIEELKKLYEDEQMTVPTEKSIMDAPALRGEDERNCHNCRFFQPLPETHLADEVTDTRAEISAPSDIVETSSGRGVCTQFDFETDIEWVCDGWEEIPLDQTTTDQTDNELMTMKQADGKYRWIIFSSSSYQDRDGEIVSQKALDDDTARMNATGEYGTLDWWHTPIILGDCDFSAMHGRISVESGTFRDDAIGAAIATAKGLGASRTFYNPITEPDAQGVYHNIKTFSRAILPAERASNALTQVHTVSAKGVHMFEDKIKKLKELLGGTPEAGAKVDALLATAEQTDKAAAAAGLTSKEASNEQLPEQTEPKTESPKAWFVGDMTPDEFDARLAAAVEKFLTPAVKEIGAQITASQKVQTATMKEQGDAVQSKFAETQKEFAQLAARMALLEGAQPRAYRATQAKDNIVDAKTEKEKQPHGDKPTEDSLAAWLAS